MNIYIHSSLIHSHIIILNTCIYECKHVLFPQMYAYMYVCTFFILICIYLHVRMCSYVHTNVNKLFFYVPYLWKCILFRMQFCASRKHTYLNIFILAPVTKINMHAQNTYILKHCYRFMHFLKHS